MASRRGQRPPQLAHRMAQRVPFSGAMASAWAVAPHRRTHGRAWRPSAAPRTAELRPFLCAVSRLCTPNGVAVASGPAAKRGAFERMLLTHLYEPARDFNWPLSSFMHAFDPMPHDCAHAGLGRLSPSAWLCARPLSAARTRSWLQAASSAGSRWGAACAVGMQALARACAWRRPRRTGDRFHHARRRAVLGILALCARGHGFLFWRARRFVSAAPA